MDNELLNKSIQIVNENKDHFSASLLQIKLIHSGFQVGIMKCNRIIEKLAELGVIEK